MFELGDTIKVGIDHEQNVFEPFDGFILFVDKPIVKNLADMSDYIVKWQDSRGKKIKHTAWLEDSTFKHKKIVLIERF